MDARISLGILGFGIIFPDWALGNVTCTIKLTQFMYDTFECDGFCCGSPEYRTCCNKDVTESLTVWNIAATILGTMLVLTLIGAFCTLAGRKKDATSPALTNAPTNASRGPAATKTTRHMTSDREKGKQSDTAAIRVVVPASTAVDTTKASAMPAVQR